VIQNRNEAAHSVGGEDVIEVLPYCTTGLREVIERAFEFLWGIPPSDWGRATPDQKSLRFEE